MASPIGGAINPMAIQPIPKMQIVQEQSMIEAGRLAERLSSQSAAPPPSGRGEVVDTFA